MKTPKDISGSARQQTVGELIDRLLQFDPLPIQQVRFDFDGDVVTALPHDAQWQLWWSRVIGPAACVTLSFLHHVAANHGELSNPADTITAMISPFDADAPLPLTELLGRSITNRLLVVHSNGAGLVYPVPRPGRESFEQINRALLRAEFEVIGS